MTEICWLNKGEENYRTNYFVNVSFPLRWSVGLVLHVVHIYLVQSILVKLHFILWQSVLPYGIINDVNRKETKFHK